MTRRIGCGLGLIGLFLGLTSPALPCNICPGLQNKLTLRQEAAQAKLILYGTMANPRLNAGGALSAGGVTDLRIEHVVKTDPFLGKKQVVEVARYIPVDAKNPPKYIVFCDIFNGKLDPYRGLPVKSAAMVDYLKGAMELKADDPVGALQFFFRYLDHADNEIATDAFLEFAKASDKEVGLVSAKLSPDKLRNLLADPQTPANRLGMFGFLLGACGGNREADFLESLIKTAPERNREALGGLLAGYIELRPKQGWDLAVEILRDARRPFPERMAALGTLRFYHGWKGRQVRNEVIQGLEVLLAQGDIADMAINDLRTWQYWELTGDVLGQYGKKSHDAPLMRRAIVRYALSCPKAEAFRFVAEQRKIDPELVRDVEEGLAFEKALPTKPGAANSSPQP